MRLFVHDYSGHPFQVQLSRWLAGQGHDVLHVYSSDVETPRGQLTSAPGDPGSFRVEPLSTGRPLPKYDLVRRRFQERAFGRKLAARAREFRPDAVISSNAPVDVQDGLQTDLRRSGIPFVFWVQDIYSLAIRHYLKRKLPGVGGLVAAIYRRLEFRLIRNSDAVVVISDDFKDILVRESVPADKVTVIENWAPLKDLPVMPRDNAWSREQGLEGKFVFLYAGTLGLKHDPTLLADLARRYADRDDVAVVVVSQGLGRKLLEEVKRDEGLKNLRLLDFQPFERMPEVLGTGDVVIAILEPEASVLSVPSKVLTYLTTGRPILSVMPSENLAARVIAGASAGKLVPPGDRAAFVEAAEALRGDKEGARSLGEAGRAYAERTFDIDVIGARFVDVIEQACAARRATA